MPFGSITLRPGVNTVKTPTLNEAGISASNLIRFRDGLVEKYGGWRRYNNQPMNSVTRALQPWQDLAGNIRLAAGNLSSLVELNGGGNITPQSVTSSPPMDVSTSKGSNIVTIKDTGINNLWQFDSVFFNTPISVGGLVLTGMYQVITGASGTTYTIAAATAATSTVASGGSVPSFTTTLNSSTVTVTLTAHGLVDDQYIAFPIATSVGGLTIQGTYQITVTGPNDFTIIANAAASSAVGPTSMNGGLPQYLYYVTNGPAKTVSYGGLGAIGQFAIGEGPIITLSVTHQAGTPITADNWSLDNWGEILMANPRGGPIFEWEPDLGLTSAAPIGSAPPLNRGIFVAMPQLILVAWGSTKSMIDVGSRAIIDPLLVRWSDVADFAEWRAMSTTQAGSFRLSSGSEIVGAIQGPNVAYIITDHGPWTMHYVGPPFIFDFTQIGHGCGLIGQNAIDNLNGQTYYMGLNNFYLLTGGTVRSIPCSVWDDVFQDLDVNNAHKSVAGANSLFDEIMFFFPSLSGGTGEPDKYAKLDVSEGVWDVGYLSRSAWFDQSVVGNPIGADPSTTLIQQHETGVDADGSAMHSWFETGYFAYGDGENSATVDHFHPDMKWKQFSSATNANINVTVSTSLYPNGGEQMSSGPMLMTNTTLYLAPRVRGRLMKWLVDSNQLGSWYRWGLTRYRFIVDGKR